MQKAGAGGIQLLPSTRNVGIGTSTGLLVLVLRSSDHTRHVLVYF